MEYKRDNHVVNSSGRRRNLASLLPALLFLVLGVLAPSRPADAGFINDVLGGMCAVIVNGGHKCESKTTVTPDLSCDIKLGSASGVPGQTKHGYAFMGTCVSTWSGAVVVVAAKGTWDGSHYIADEAINIENEGSAGLGGGIVSKFRCQADPWLNHKTICSLIERHATSLPNNFSYSSPATAEFVTPAKATALSKKHTAAAPPPPPPAAPPKTIQRPNGFVGVRKSAGHVSGGLMTGATGVKAAPAKPGAFRPAQPIAQFPPKLRFMQVNQKIDYQCADLRKFITFSVTLHNDGGPLAARHGSLYVKEDNGYITGPRVSVPSLAHAASKTVTLTAGMPEAHRGQVPGVHHLVIDLTVNGKQLLYFPTEDFGPHECQRQLRAPSAAQRHLKVKKAGYPPSPCIGDNCRHSSHLQPGGVTSPALPAIQSRP